MLAVIRQRKIWFAISSALVVAGIIVFITIGLNLGIDFTGGSLLEIEFLTARPGIQQINDALTPLELGNVVVQPAGEKRIILRFQEIDEETHQQILTLLEEKFQSQEEAEITGIGDDGEEVVAMLRPKVIEEKKFDSIGPTIGQELKKKTIWAIAIVLIAIIGYVAWAFRKVSKPVASWKYGLIAVITLFHDIIITIGVFVILGKFYNIEVNAPFVAALLTILGYSVNDTIVVFDRTRENLIHHLGEEFEKIVQKSVNEVITRSINTSFTTLGVLFAILLFGGQTIRSFILALIVGIAIGTYSSIFLASPLLVAWEKFRSKR